MRPYIGVTGITNAKQIRELARLFPVDNYPGPLFKATILVTDQTLLGGANYSNRYPKIEGIQQIFSSPTLLEANVMQCIRYKSSSMGGQLRLELLALVGLVPPRTTLTGIELDIDWPSPKVLREFTKLTENRYDFIIRLSQTALKISGSKFFYSPEELVQRVKEYQSVSSRAVFDLELSPEIVASLSSYITAIDQTRTGTGVTGGLSAETLDTIRPLLEKNPKLSIDALAKVRDKEDHLDLEKASDFIKKGLSLYRSRAVLQT